MTQDKILELTQGKKYFCGFDLSKKMKVNYGYVTEAIVNLLEENKITQVGQHFSETHGKLFPYYTQEQDLGKLHDIKNSISNRQFASQKLMLVRRLVKDIEEHHGVKTQLQAALQLIKTQTTKIELSFHALKTDDIIACYELVIIHGTNAEYHYLENKVKPSRKLKQAA